MLTKRNRGVSIQVVIAQLNKMLRGWIGYFARSSMKTYLQNLMGWIRRRIRQFLWKQWRNKDNRRRKLRQLGTPEWILAKWKLGSNSYWKMAGVSNSLITNKMLHTSFGLIDAVEFYSQLHAKRMEADWAALTC